MRLLVVDDSNGTRNAIRAGLIGYGYQVETAKDGDSGWVWEIQGLWMNFFFLLYESVKEDSDFWVAYAVAVWFNFCLVNEMLMNDIRIDLLVNDA